MSVRRGFIGRACLFLNTLAWLTAFLSIGFQTAYAQSQEAISLVQQIGTLVRDFLGSPSVTVVVSWILTGTGDTGHHDHRRNGL